MNSIPHVSPIRPCETLIVAHGDPGHFVTLTGDGRHHPSGSLTYPFLQDFARWEIHTMPVEQAYITAEELYPALRLVREKKVVDILIPTEQATPRHDDLPGLGDGCGTVEMRGLPTAEFLARLGLTVSLHKGAAVAGKRLSRLFSPYRYWHFLPPEQIYITHDPTLNPRLWDGCGLVSRAFIERHLDAFLAHTPQHLQRRYRRELAHTRRWEITLMHSGGQEKGDVLVVDDLDGDFLFPAGSSKREVRLHGRVFVGLAQPRHAKDQMRLDVQSLINHHRFFTTERLLTWLKQESQFFLAGLHNGEIEQLLHNLLNVDSAEALTKLEKWWLGSYFAGGGEALWFAGVVQALARQRHKQLALQINGKHRFPIPGARLYIFPAAVGGREVPSGHVTLDFACATAFVADSDWLAYIVPVLGGCDGDDAVWLFPFRDQADDDKRKLLLWRSPNQDGEYVLLQPTASSDDVGNGWPLLDSRHLSPRIDTPGNDDDIFYSVLPQDTTAAPPDLSALRLPELRTRAKALKLRHTSRLRKAPLIQAIQAAENAYTVSAMTPAIARAICNKGTLGMFVNVLLVTKALFGRVPRQLPARLEDVIDGMVKTGGDLSPVKRWCERAADQIARQGVGVPTGLAKRIARMTQRPLTASTDHWFDELLNGARDHLLDFQVAVDVLSKQCCPPQAIFDAGRPWLDAAAEVHSAYSHCLGTAVHSNTFNGDTYRTAYKATLQGLAQWPEHQRELFAGLACHIYSGGLATSTADNILWQTNKDDELDIAHRFLWALRELGLIGLSCWENGRAHLSAATVDPVPCLPLTINGVWFNWLRVQRPDTPTEMGAIDKPTASWAKRQLTQRTSCFVGLALTAASDDNGRIRTYTPHGNLFGYVQKGQEPQLNGTTSFVITHVVATRDGNLQLVTTPVA